MSLTALSLDTFETDQPLVSRFFKQALASQTLAHGYVFKGGCLPTMYRVALTLAKMLNCANQSSPVTAACGQCASCHWIADNAHPSVMTISRLTYLVGDDGRDLDEEGLNKLAKKASQPTQIKVEQINRLLAQLAVRSDGYRVIIFTDVEVLPPAQVLLPPAPLEWRSVSAHEESALHFRPLNRKIFNAASANRFLKTLEEPPPKTIFIFLTDAEENLLETIVSRCQVLPFQPEQKPVSEGAQEMQLQHKAYQELLSLAVRSSDPYPVVKQLESGIMGAFGLSLEQTLEGFQGFLADEFKTQQPVSQEAFHQYRGRQQLLQNTLRSLQAKTNPEQLLFQSFMTFSQV